MLTFVLEWIREFVSDLVSHHSRDTDAARLRQRLQTRSYVDTVAENVALVGDDIANVDADAKPYPAVFWHIQLALGHPVLDLYGAAHGINHAGKLCQEAVAGVFLRSGRGVP